MSGLLQSPVVSLLRSMVSSPLLTSVRFYEKRRFLRRFGYRPHYHKEGLLPRIEGETLPLKSSPNNPRLDEWRPELTKFGTNDYIDILGDGKLSPMDTMTSVPHWLRRFRGREMQMLIRKRSEKRHWKWSRPQSWHDLNKRIDYLYKKVNFKTAPQPPEYPSNY